MSMKITARVLSSNICYCYDNLLYIPTVDKLQ